MALTSASTTAQVKAAYEDNLDYDITDSVSKCKDFIQAARFLIRRMAEEVELGRGARVKDSYKKIEAELKRALAWWASNDATATTSRHKGDVKLLSIGSDFRS